jgi:hypothetical protein
MSQNDKLQGLTSLEREILDHWREFRPRMCRRLGENLIPAVKRAASLTMAALHQLMTEGNLPHNQAWEMVREEWAFLPEENDSTD